MVISINALAEPVGSMKQWLRADATVSLPAGWLICDGSTVVDASSSFDGKALPDLRSAFPRGHGTLTNATFAADTLYFAGGTIPSGGSDSANLSHAHSVFNHSHTIANHSHQVTLPIHSHSLPAATQFVSQTTGSTPGNQGLTGPGPGANGHNHLIGGSTGSLNFGTIATGNAGSVTSSDGGTTNNSLGATGTLPPFNDFVTIIKVK